MLNRCFLQLVMLFAAMFAVRGLHADEIRRSTVYERNDGGDSGFGYRIPALVVTKSGSLLAFCERRVGLRDHAQNDIVVRRSTDGGETWGRITVIADAGGDSLNDPCAVQLNSGRVLLRYKRYPQGVHQRKSSHTVRADPGYGGLKNVRIYFAHSDDDGTTWSAPSEVSRQIKRPEAIAVGSPGTAIQLQRGPHRGRIVFPHYESFPDGPEGTRFDNAVSWSDDGGATWQVSDLIGMNGDPGEGNEAQVVELADGSILMSARTAGSSIPARRTVVSHDGGVNWTDFRLAREMRTPACMSSVIRYSLPTANTPGLLLHSVPNTRRSRKAGSIFLSENEGKSWQLAGVLERGPFAYSCLGKLPGGDITCLYEAGNYQSIVCARFSIDWIKSGGVKLTDELPAGALTTSFEDQPAGPFTSITTAAGTWIASGGHAEIDHEHSHTGDQCLHILGGRDRVVEMEFPRGVGAIHEVRFQAERWTRRDPFAFSVEAKTTSGWREIYNGDLSIQVGTFRTSVRISIDGPTPARLRFKCTSLAHSGMLVDDFAVIPVTAD